MENQNQNKNGKWEVLSNYITGVGERYIVARLINVDEPMHSGNLEHYGEYTSDKASAERIANALNEMEGRENG